MRWQMVLLTGLLSGSALLNVRPAAAAAIQVQQVDNGSMPQVISSMVVPYSPDAVWPVISNPQQLTRNAPKVRQLSLVSQKGKTQDLAYKVKLNALLPEFAYVLRYQPKGAYKLGFQRVSGSFKAIHGYWQVTPEQDGRASRITYSLAMDPGFAAPSPLVVQAVKMDVPQLMRHVKNLLDLQVASSTRNIARR